ncbi:BQ2448_796 [Microbotryum intermedium]|uniref:BQ2448_796 protein n=1 Tax=Microbotryum intermedium TaxID=269621 RepID=A0A238F697_9BASI|nr:BQ2448_796 [Microbotryum intermedium]
MDQIANLFATYSSVSDEHHDGADVDPMHRTIPLAVLPQLIDTFEEQRGTVLLQEDEKDKLKAFAAQMPDQRVGVDMLISFIAASAASASTTPAHDEANDEQDSSNMMPTVKAQLGSDSGDNAPRPSSPTSPAVALGLLKPDPFDSIADGSPAPRRRADSSRTQSDTSSLPGSPVNKPVIKKKRSFLAGKLSFGASPARSSTPNGLEGSRALAATLTAQQHELADLVASRGGTYLGVPLDGAVGSLDVNGKVESIRTAMRSQGVGRDKELATTLSSLTWPQIRAIDRAYEKKFGTTLLDYVSTSKGLKGELEYALRGLIMGPLNFDVHLLSRALESSTTNTVNLYHIHSAVARFADASDAIPQSLLIDLLVARPPSDVALLRAAYRFRSSALNTTSAAVASIGSRHKTLDAAVLASATSNTKLKKAWEIVLQAKWEGTDEEGNSVLSPEQRKELLNNDLDMLKVGLRKGGNSDFVTKILLARSPAHVHALTLEYRSHPHSLSQSIKQVYSTAAPALAKLLLHAVENGKNNDDGPGVWRDAKSLEAAVKGPGARNDMLAWRLVRLHWNRPRFVLVQKAYSKKYKKPLLDRVLGETTPASAFRDAVRCVINSASLAEPEMTADDERRLAALASKHNSTTLPDEVSKALVGAESSGASTPSPTELEGTGELSNPPSPRANSPEAERIGSPDGALSQSSSPTALRGFGIPPSASEPILSLTAEGNSTSSLSYIQRTIPLEPLGHRPGSSARGSLDSSTNSLRHARPIAPSRRRRPSEDFNKSTSSSGSLEARSPNESDLRSGSLSPASFARSPTPTTMLEGSSFIRSRTRSSTPTDVLERPSSRRSSTTPSERPLSPSMTSSPVSAIDTTSYYSAPIFPIRDEDEHEPSVTSTRFFGEAPGSPETPLSYRMQRDASSASSNSGTSRPGSIFQVEGMGLGGDFQLADLHDGSPFTGRNDPETTQSMWRYATELSKKHKELEDRLSTSASSYEEQINELEGRLEEMRAELVVKRREEKDLRSNERQHLQQISALEGEVAKMTKALEKARESYDSMKRNYLDQCEEAEKLRSLVAETRRENRAAEEASHAQSLQAQQLERDREILQGAISRLEADLRVASQAQDTLDAQKQENLVLKETIDRLRFDLEEMQSSNRKSGFLEGGMPDSPDRAGMNSMSRSLGKELARNLAQEAMAARREAEEDSGESGEAEDSDEVNETVVTTHRTIHKKKTKKRSGTLTGPEPFVQRLQQSIVLAEVETQTESPEVRAMDVQTDLSGAQVRLIAAPLIDQEVSVTLQPHAATVPLTNSELRAKFAQELGIDLLDFDRALESTKRGTLTSSPPRQGVTLLAREHFGARRAGRYLSRMSTKAATQAPQLFINCGPLQSQVFPGFAKPYVAQILESSLTFCLYSGGTLLTPISHHHHFTPFQVQFGAGDVTHNTLWGEGMVLGSSAADHASEGLAFWLERMVWNGVSSVRRVPT